jgi:alpha-tubulin suppressor-like RCC1 family protein
MTRYEPTRIGTDSDWKMVTAGELHTVALKTDRSLWAWGANGNGRLGDGGTQESHVPRQVSGY